MSPTLTRNRSPPAAAPDGRSAAASVAPPLAPPAAPLADPPAGVPAVPEEPPAAGAYVGAGAAAAVVPSAGLNPQRQSPLSSAAACILAASVFPSSVILISIGLLQVITSGAAWPLGACTKYLLKHDHPEYLNCCPPR